MKSLNAVYVRMNLLLEEMGTVTEKLYLEIHALRERMSGLHVSWEGEAFESYSRVLTEDITVMEIIALDTVLMYQLLSVTLRKYTDMEKRINEIIGGLL